MAMEVVCGNCQGRLLVEHTGVVVACPHCGAHLQIGEPTPPAAEAPPPSDVPPAPQSLPPQSEAPAPYFAPEPPPVPAVAAEASLFPVSFESPPPVIPQPAAAAEPTFPQFNFAPPTTPAEPAINNTLSATAPVIPEPAAAPLWAPSPPPISLPAADPETDSWMPQINLTMPTATIEAPALAHAAPPLAEPETATLLTPAMPVVDLSPSTVNLAGGDAPHSPPAHQTDIWSPSRLENSRVEEPVIAFPGPEPSFPNFGNFGATPAPVSYASNTPAPTPTLPAIPSSPAVEPTAAAPAEPLTASEPDRSIPTPRAPRGAVVPRLYFVVVASYASAITLAFLYIWWKGSISTLDLPDVIPAIKNGQYGLSLIDESPLPSAYRLKLGESKRFGNLLVTPLKVTKGPLEFVHFSNPKEVKDPSPSPVLKLWVKFENVSTDQTFPALDERLLFQRVPDKKNAPHDRANNYLCLQSECKRLGKRIPVYAFPINGEWLLKDQNLNTPLPPKKEWETYIPTNDEDLSDLKGPLCWRLHFRKGYNPESHRGVTTLVEVEFDSKDIQVDS